MNKELYQKILNFLNSPETENKLQGVLALDFNAEQKENFLKIWEQIKDLDFNIDDLYYFLIFIFDGDIDKTEKVDDALFENIFIEVYNELIELYKENKMQEMENGKKESNDLNTDMESNPEELGMKYNNWTHSSLWQNILAAEENLKSKFLLGGVLDEKNIKEEFYEALNGSDKIKVVAVLRVLAGVGKLGASFGDDKRYIDFWGSFLERHYGAEIKEKFVKDPVNQKYLVEFLRFVLEKRLNFKAEESAMIGMGLAELCGGAGEMALAEMAYGDESKNGFEWNE